MTVQPSTNYQSTRTSSPQSRVRLRLGLPEECECTGYTRALPTTEHLDYRVQDSLPGRHRGSPDPEAVSRIQRTNDTGTLKGFPYTPHETIPS